MNNPMTGNSCLLLQIDVLSFFERRVSAEVQMDDTIFRAVYLGINISIYQYYWSSPYAT